jgi:diguanylate cyclase (GGDEF)-like protein
LHDPLTRLPNQRLLHDRVEHALVLRARGRTGVAAPLADLDSLKQVNDTFGYDVGDEVLVEVAGRLAQRVRGRDTLAASQRDEHVVLPEEIADREQATSVGQRVLAEFMEPGQTVAGSISVSVSIGAHVATDQDNYDWLLRAADGAR